MSHLIAGKAAGMAVSAIVKRLLARLPLDRSRAELDRLRDELTAEFQADVIAALARLVELHFEGRAELADQLAFKVDRHEAAILFAQLYEQSLKSSQRERRRLMAAAVAGIYTPDLDGEMRSRVARVVADLEPSDVQQLRRFAPHILPEGSHTLLQAPAVNFAALLQHGCVLPRQDRAVGVSGDLRPAHMERYIEMTELGRALLRFIETWAPESDAEALPVT